MAFIIIVLLVGLAAANGANDVSKGVATLAGAGVTKYRTAILWGTATTLIGGLVSIMTGGAMGKLFSAGIVSAPPTEAFALAVLVGAVSWVTLATLFRLPVSTTHAIVGALIGAGLLFAPDTVLWNGLVTKVVAPLLLSIVVAYGGSVLIALVLKALRPTTTVHADTASAVEIAPAATRTTGRAVISALHWISSGTTSMARGLNDTPKIAAVGAFALIPAGMSAEQVSLLVAGAMGVGSLLGLRVARTLGERVIKLGHAEGFQANLITTVLVGAGATLGWPMSTTHVSTGAIAGTAGADVSRLNKKTIRDFAIAWTVTPAFGALVAAVVYLIIR